MWWDSPPVGKGVANDGWAVGWGVMCAAGGWLCLSLEGAGGPKPCLKEQLGSLDPACQEFCGRGAGRAAFACW